MICSGVRWVPNPFSTAPSGMSRTSDPLIILALATGGPGDDFSIMGVDQECQADHIAVPADEPQAVGTPAQVQPQHDDLAVVGVLEPIEPGALQQQAVAVHDAIRGHYMRTVWG